MISNDMAKVAAAIESTRRPFLRIDIAKTEETLAPTASKLGGVPYVPVGADIPRDEPFVFIAQINFANVALDPYPRAGLLQLWVAGDDLFGSLREDRSGFRVRYIQDLGLPARTDISLPRIEMSPVDPRISAVGRGMRFTLDTEMLGTEDCRWKPFLASIGVAETPKDAYERYRNVGHRIGGYCGFTQDDPRDPSNPSLSLLQLDSDQNVFWGDSGLGHWFIREDQLRAKDFSQVDYYWDCC